jgi:hypothetical protein
MGDSSQSKVANPALVALKSLRNDLARDVETYRDALSTTAGDMGGKKVWTGKAARAWEQHVAHQRSQVKTMVDKLLPIVDAEIARTPAEVTQSEARQWHLNQSQRIYV